MTDELNAWLFCHVEFGREFEENPVVPPTAAGSRPPKQPFPEDSLPSCGLSPKRMHRRTFDEEVAVYQS